MLSFHFNRTNIKESSQRRAHLEIFSIVSSARTWTSLILAAKSGNRRQSATGFSKNAVLAETSYHDKNG